MSIVHLLVIVQNNKRCTVQRIKIKKKKLTRCCVLTDSEFEIFSFSWVQFGRDVVPPYLYINIPNE